MLVLKRRKILPTVSVSEFLEFHLLTVPVVSIAYDTLSNPEKKKQYDKERLDAVTLAMIRRELSSPNQNYYQLFQLAPPGQDLAPLTAEEKAKLDQVGGNYIEVVRQSRANNEEELLKCKCVLASKA